jgi:hypothetical protein
VRFSTTDYLRCNYRIQGGRIDDTQIQSFLYAGNDTSSIGAGGQYYTDMTAYISYTASVLWWKAYYHIGNQPTASYPVLVDGHISYSTSMFAVIEARYLKGFGANSQSASAQLLVFPTTSVSAISWDWDCLVISHQISPW